MKHSELVGLLLLRQGLDYAVLVGLEQAGLELTEMQSAFASWVLKFRVGATTPDHELTSDKTIKEMKEK